jgi:hypothetical protein
MLVNSWTLSQPFESPEILGTCADKNKNKPDRMAFVRPSGGLGLRPKNLPGAPPLDSLNPRREGVQKLKLLDPEKGDPCRSVKGLSRHILPHPKTGDGVRYSTIPLTPLPLSGEKGARL